MASSSSSTTPPWKDNHVFLSFRGADTRYGFTGHLYAALNRKKIRTFIDYRLEEGEEIESAMLSNIENSMISVIILSERYADSTWCLDELVKIFECREKFHQIVIPVFYKVDPDDVSSLTGSFGEGFGKLDGKITLAKRRKYVISLKKASDVLKAFVLHEKSHFRDENELVETIVQSVWDKLCAIRSNNYNNDNLVGAELDIENIESLLSIESKENLCNIVGIWGMGGIGKTALAKAVFDKIKNKFDRYCFVEDIREESTLKGLNTLRKELLSKIFMEDKVDTSSFFIKENLGHQKVLIVLDDVMSVEQIEHLIGEFTSSPNPKSRIIITTRNKEVLKSYKVHRDCIYKVEGLPPNEALKLFSRCAFGQNHPKPAYLSLSNKVVEYAKGVPFTLKELGNFLCKYEEIDDWESKIKKIQIFPPEDTHKMLRLSYDRLGDVKQRIFLDIAFFFRSENKDLVIKVLTASNGFGIKTDIDDLVDNCLLSITNNQITMIDLFQLMGREIVRSKSPDYPERRSHLWYDTDIRRVLRMNKGIENIRGICWDMYKIKDVHLSTSAFGGMANLELLKLHSSYSNEGSNINKIKDFNGMNSVQLTYLCWHGCPLKSLQSNFDIKNLVALDMPHSDVEELWRVDDQHFDNLRHVNLSHSKRLFNITSLSRARNLESLILEGCVKLCDISSSIHEDLKMLVILNMRHCRSLKSLPNIGKLRSLKVLHLLGCSELDQNSLNVKIKDVLHKIEHLEEESRATRFICFPGSEIHEWFASQCPGHSISLTQPDGWFNRESVSFALCAVVNFEKCNCEDQRLDIGYDFKDGRAIFHSGTLRSWDYVTGPCNIASDHVFLCFEFHVPFLPKGNSHYNDELLTIEFYVKDLNGEPMSNCEVIRCGFRPLQCQEVGNLAEYAVNKDQENAGPARKKMKI